MKIIKSIITLFIIVIITLIYCISCSSFDKDKYLKLCGLDINKYILPDSVEDSLALLVFKENDTLGKYHRNRFLKCNDIKSCEYIVSYFSYLYNLDKNKKLLYNHYFAKGALISNSKRDIISITLNYARNLSFEAMKQVGEVSFPMIRSISDTLAFQSINRIIPGICNGWKDFIGYDKDIITETQAIELYYWSKKGLEYAKSSFGYSSELYYTMLRHITFSSWKINSPDFSMYADSLIDHMIRRNDRNILSGNEFYGAIYNRYVDYLDNNDYVKADKILDYFTPLEYKEFLKGRSKDINIAYRPIIKILPNRVKRNFRYSHNSYDSKFVKLLANSRDHLWEFYKLMQGNNTAPNIDIMYYAEKARLNYLKKQEGYTGWLNYAFYLGVLHTFPSSSFVTEYVDNIVRSNYQYNQNIVNYLTFQYQNLEPKCVYDALLYIKGASEQIPSKIFNSIKENTPREIYKYADSIRRYNIPSRPGWERDLLENEIGPRIKHILESNIVSFSDVQKSLNENEAAIEFYAAPSFSFSDDIYKAAILLPNNTEPTIVHIETERVIKDIISSPKLYEDVKGYEIIWHPIEKILSNTKTIYFSMDKLLNLCNIQALKTPDNIRLNQKYNFKQLSSTKEIINKENLQYTSIALFGDINYDYIDSLNINKKDFNNKSENESQQKSIYRSFKKGSFSPLIYAKTEINDILNHANDNKIKALCYTGKNASEEEFKNLSGEKISILHIATHGFYYSKNNTSKKEYINDISVDNMPLNRCGLIMSKSNNSPQNQLVQNNREDGILFGTEIARLDFTDVDLVVLSACCTALGDLNNEGVSGLRQAFKLAGAKSLLITLNNVDDKASSFFMNIFYKELLKTNDKSHSFNYAIKKMRESAEFSEPRFWSPFILID